MKQISLDFALPIVASAALVGFALGMSYFASLRLTVQAYAAPRGWRAAMALTGARLIGALIVFSIAARFGAGALLAAFGGFLIARTVAMRRQWRVH
ncbi:MAG TPA: ATP synthase subunit I [Steroidobacteraceae bacterium]|nr:ATP synthase subunit I [Steroidobacteraceae bacterium]